MMELFTPTNVMQASMIIIEATLLLLVFLVIQLSHTICDMQKKNTTKSVDTKGLPEFKYSSLKISKEVDESDKQTKNIDNISVHVSSDGSITSTTTTRVQEP